MNRMQHARYGGSKANSAVNKNKSETESISLFLNKLLSQVNITITGVNPMKFFKRLKKMLFSS